MIAVWSEVGDLAESESFGTYGYLLDLMNIRVMNQAFNVEGSKRC